MIKDPRVLRPIRLIVGALNPPRGGGRVGLALTIGVLCHATFALAVLAMILTMYFGMSESFGTLPWPWAIFGNAFLVLQFPLGHSLLLTPKGRKFLNRIVPGDYGKTLSTTTYAMIASLQLLALFALWTPSGIVWWRADGAALWTLSTLYAGTWMFLMKASFDAGVEVQSGALGWMSLIANRRAVYPGMPVRGLFKHIRQPIYLAFAMTLWAVPVWTPDQLCLAVILSAYCILAPKLKEKRFLNLYGERFERYRASVPYMLPKRND